jgi:hypothetical protein
MQGLPYGGLGRDHPRRLTVAHTEGEDAGEGEDEGEGEARLAPTG